MSAVVPPTISDRLMSAFRALIRAEDPNRTFRGIYEYIVANVSAAGDTADAAPTDPTVPLPAILRIPLRSGLLGDTAKLTVGNRCLLAFVNGDPTRPIIVGSDPVPQTSQIDATQTITVGSVAFGTLIPTTPGAAARVGDQVGPFTITRGSTKVQIGG